ncbi:MAG: hypothetical protein WC635_11965 [Bacteriovorax sp.]
MKLKSHIVILATVSSLMFSSVSPASTAIFAPAMIVTASVSTVALKGLALTLFGAGSLYATGKVVKKKGPLFGFPLFAVGGIALILGFMALENEEGGTVQFKTLSDADAAKLDINASELISYNNSVDILNAIQESATAEALKFASEDEQIAASNKVWTDSKELLSEETLSATKKILSQNAQ